MPMKTCYKHVPQRLVMCGLSMGVMLVCFLEQNVFYNVLRELVYTSPDIGSNTSSSISPCPFMMSENSLMGHLVLKKVYPWSLTLQHAITRPFYIGYIITLPPAGVMADFYDAKGILGWGCLISSITFLLYPLIIQAGINTIMLGQLFQGIGQGMVFPSLTVVVAQWSPHTERSTFVGIIESGRFSGIAMAFLIPLLCKPVRESWEAKFFLAGVIGVIWSVLWFALAYSKPNCCPHITDKERTLIYKYSDGLDRIRSPEFPHCVPWKQMFQSSPLLSLLLFDFGSSWMYYTMAHTMTRFLMNIVHLTNKVSYNSFMTAASAAILSCMLWGLFSDWLINHNVLTRTLARKWFGFLGNILMIPFILFILLAKCNGYMVTAFYTCFFFLRGLVLGGYYANLIDVSPQHAGVIKGIANCGEVVASLLTYWVFKQICHVSGDPTNWSIHFLVSVSIFVVCSIPYMWLGSAEVQPWNYLSLITSISLSRTP